MRSLFLVLLVVLVIAPVAHAQDRRAEARVAFEEATRAFDQDDFVLALERYRLAFSLAPRDAVRFNIAVCLERLGRIREAAHEYATAAASTELPATAIARARARLAEVRARLGTLVVDGPAGAVVEVDGAVLCTTPCEELVDPGDHRVHIRLPDGSSRSELVTITRGRALRLHAEPSAPGAAVLRAPPSASLAASAAGGGRDGAPTPALAIAPPIANDATRAAPSLGALSWLGAGLSLAGAISAIAFGVHTQSVWEAFQLAPTPTLAADGELGHGMFHGSLVTVALGGALFLIDLARVLSGP